MKNLIIILLLLTYNFAFGQKDKEKEIVKSFVDEIIIPGNFNLDLYQKHIRYYNGLSPSDTVLFNSYIRGLESMTVNIFTNRVKNKNDVKIIDITGNTEAIKKYIKDIIVLPSYKLYRVAESDDSPFLIIILDKNDNIISFISALNKSSDQRSRPLFLNNDKER